MNADNKKHSQHAPPRRLNVTTSMVGIKTTSKKPPNQTNQPNNQTTKKKKKNPQQQTNKQTNNNNNNNNNNKNPTPNRSHTAKNHTKMVNPKDIAGNAEEEEVTFRLSGLHCAELAPASTEKINEYVLLKQQEQQQKQQQQQQCYLFLSEETGAY